MTWSHARILLLKKKSTAPLQFSNSWSSITRTCLAVSSNFRIGSTRSRSKLLRRRGKELIKLWWVKYMPKLKRIWRRTSSIMTILRRLMICWLKKRRGKKRRDWKDRPGTRPWTQEEPRIFDDVIKYEYDDDDN